MKAVLGDDPHYYWAWSQLADWQQQSGRWAEYLEAAQNMVRLAPHNSTAHAYRGEARLRVGERGAGKADLQKALDINPDYPFAGMILFDAQFEDQEWDAAAGTLKMLQESGGGDYVLAREVRMLARETNLPAAEEAAPHPVPLDRPGDLASGNRAPGHDRRRLGRARGQGAG